MYRHSKSAFLQVTLNFERHVHDVQVGLIPPVLCIKIVFKDVVQIVVSKNIKKGQRKKEKYHEVFKLPVLNR